MGIYCFTVSRFLIHERSFSILSVNMMLSFTSAKNREPHTLQIVVRTEEISNENKTTDITDKDPEVEKKVSPLRRMRNVFVKMGKAMAEMFKNR